MPQPGIAPAVSSLAAYLRKPFSLPPMTVDVDRNSLPPLVQEVDDALLADVPLAEVPLDDADMDGVDALEMPPDDLPRCAPRARSDEPADDRHAWCDPARLEARMQAIACMSIDGCEEIDSPDCGPSFSFCQCPEQDRTPDC